MVVNPVLTDTIVTRFPFTYAEYKSADSFYVSGDNWGSLHVLNTCGMLVLLHWSKVADVVNYKDI